MVSESWADLKPLPHFATIVPAIAIFAPVCRQISGFKCHNEVEEIAHD
jgi:hypothetical protein